jgi:nitrite reductase/ring-hydroxylating ferredoxin subunit
MAATSHDFWLANLSAPVWKSLHMLVYVAYLSLIVHVVYGILQAERALLYPVLVGVGAAGLIILHLMAARKSNPAELKKSPSEQAEADGFVEACAVDSIPENRAKIVFLSGERVAIFRYEGKVSAVSNVCQHQNGPLGEGKIVDGCITCPWHSFQYYPDSGKSPEPFTERVPTFQVRIAEGRVFVHPQPNPAGTQTEPATIES